MLSFAFTHPIPLQKFVAQDEQPNEGNDAVAGNDAGRTQGESRRLWLRGAVKDVELMRDERRRSLQTEQMSSSSSGSPTSSHS